MLFSSFAVAAADTFRAHDVSLRNHGTRTAFTYSKTMVLVLSFLTYDSTPEYIVRVLPVVILHDNDDMHVRGRILFLYW